jgi:hypothetical protein
MTPLERAEAVFCRWVEGIGEAAYVSGDAQRFLTELIQVAIIEATNAEVERRRTAERALEQCNAMRMLRVSADSERTRILVYNPHRQQWTESSLIHLPGEPA